MFGGVDTGLSEILMPITRSEEFSKMLEIQQSECTISLNVVMKKNQRADDPFSWLTLLRHHSGLQSVESVGSY